MKKLHLICNAHIDPVWQWEWEEGAAAALSTFQSAVNLAEEYDYIFCHNEAILYQYTETYAPSLFKQICELVKKGKWHIMGGWYLQPDCLMPDGEGIVRQIREGELYFSEKFGVKPSTAIGFDAFGHSRGIVQIIKKCGQDSYMFVRPYGNDYGAYNQLDLPDECFLWQGYDDSVIKAQRISGYNSTLGHSCDKIRKDIKDSQTKEVAVSAWGVGNHGGGPSRKDLADIEKLMAESDIAIVHSTPENYFAEVSPEKVYDRSLISCMPGCYTSMINVKQKYRGIERDLFFVEKMMSVAALKGVTEYDSE
ncbi:MAG: alpha-mannosidase, partial [Clostridia bacterium]|nr:alpha-mannosidase [Clostridia bacterium]